MRIFTGAVRIALFGLILAGASAARAQNHAPTNIGLSGDRDIPEYSPAGTLVGELRTIDPDPGNTFTYTFGSPFSNSHGEFKVVGAQLQVDRTPIANNTGHPCTIISTDQGGLSTSKTFTISVHGVNDPPTDIHLGPSSVPENSANGTLVGFLTSASADAADTYTYTFVAPSTNAGGRFNITDVAALRVLNGSLLNYEVQTSHNISLRSTDSGGLTFSKTLTVQVNNVNEAPVNMGLSGAHSVVEGPANGANIGTLSTVDPDSPETFFYTFAAPESNAGGRFQIAGSQLQVANGQLIDYETGVSLAVHVRSSDHGGLTTSKVFIITVVNVVDETPANIALSGDRSVYENSPNGTEVGVLTTIHPGGGGTFTYTFIAPQGDAGGRFKVVGNKLQVANGTLLDYEIKKSHAVQIRTTSGIGQTTDKVFTITVLNEPGARSF